MVNWTANIWDVRAHDGRSREHVPAQPVWSAIGMRILQLILAFIILVMTAYAASQFGTGDLAGFGLAWFTFILTFGYIIYLAVSLFNAPHIYHYWAQLAVESLLVIFWLCTWAVLASEAAQLSPFDDYYSYGYVYSYGGRWRSAVNCMKASAALGALLWLTFIITLVFFVMALLSHRKTAAGHTTGPVSDKPVIDGPAPVEMQNQAQHPAYPQQAYQAPHQDSPYETQPQQTYPVEQPHQGYHVGEHPPQGPYGVDQQKQQQQQAPYPVDQSQQAYAIPDHQQNQAYAVPENREPHHQV